MKKSLLIIAILLVTTVSFSQKKEKVKGSKVVTIERKEIESFDALEISDNLEIFLVKGSENSLEIEADDNLHQAIDITLSGSILRLSTLKDVIASKKLSVKVYYTDSFKSIFAKNQSQVTAISDLELEAITIKTVDDAKVIATIKTSNVTIDAEDKSKLELNIKSDNAKINLTKSSTLKALISSTELTFDQYQKSQATVDGDVVNLKLRLDNNSTFLGKNLFSKTTDITIESYANASINVKETLTISASGKSEIDLYGDQKIIVNRFEDSSVLRKKMVK